jgi:hypothetical protein
MVPAKHRVDGFGQLSAVRLINTAGVNPCQFEAVLEGLVTEALDLSKICSSEIATLLQALKFLQRYFVGAPSMRQYSVRLPDGSLIIKGSELLCYGV